MTHESRNTRFAYFVYIVQRTGSPHHHNQFTRVWACDNIKIGQAVPERSHRKQTLLFQLYMRLSEFIDVFSGRVVLLNTLN